MKEIAYAIRPVIGRIRLTRAIFGLCLGALAASASAAGWIIASRIVPIEGLATALILSAAVALLLPALVCVVWPVKLSYAAQRADESGLKERVRTALGLSGDTPMEKLQRQDALSRLQALNAKEALPIRPGKWHLISALALLVVTCALLIMPNPQSLVLAERGQFRDAMSRQVEKIEKAAERIDADTLSAEEMRRLTELLREMQKTMRESNQPREALEAIDKAQRELESLLQQAQQRKSQSLDKAIRDAGLDSLANALGKGGQEAEAALSEMLKSEEEREAIQQALEEAAEAQADQDVKQALGAAAQAAGSNNAQAAVGALSGENLSGAAQSMASVNALLRAARAGVSGGKPVSASELGAGTGTGTGSGTGSGSGSGTGSGSGSGSGNGTGGGAGDGTTNEGGGDGFQGSQINSDGGTRDPRYRQGEYEEIYDPTRLGGGGDDEFLDGKPLDGESQQIQLAPGLGDDSGGVPYNEVVGEYRDAAARASERQDLPEHVRRWVDEYFSSIVD